MKDSIEHMVVNGRGSRSEIQLCLDRGLKSDLTRDETAAIIQKAFDTVNFKPFGTVTGNTQLEKLLSVNSWMTQQMIDNEIRLEKERESLRIQILPGKYATTIESIGSILFEDPAQAKTFIKEDVLKSTIAQKDMVLGLEVGNISKKASKDLHAAFLEIIYKLNRSLPYRFNDNVYAKTVEEFCTLTFDNEQSLKLGKEQFKKGYVEIWLKETNTFAYEKFLKIRDSAENLDLAFLAFLYTFSPSLPYRFAGSQMVKTPEELFIAINANKANWVAGNTELFDSSIPVWLKTTGKATIADRWNAVKSKFLENRNVGLEEFLHLLNENAEYPRIAVDKKEIKILDIQAGQVIRTDLVFTNETRGFANGFLSLSKTLDGVSLSTASVFHNAAAGIQTAVATLSIDSTKLLKGVNYETSIIFNSSAGQKIEIPVSFKIVFPRNAFILETAKYAGIAALVFGLCRLLLASSYPDWLSHKFPAFVDPENAVRYASEFAIFGWSFFLLLCCSAFGVYLLTKYLMRK